MRAAPFLPAIPFAERDVSARPSGFRASPTWRWLRHRLRLFRPGVAPWEPPWAAIGAAMAAALGAALGASVAPALAASPPRDSAPIAVMGLSLAMTPTQVLAVLRPQARGLRVATHACPGTPAARCIGRIRTRTPDGWLSVRFADPAAGDSGAGRAWRIRLVIAGAGAGAGAADPRVMRAAAAAHYGPPTEPDRSLWCPGRPAGSVCPPDRPRLHLVRRADGSSVLSLSDPGLRARRRRAAAPSAIMQSAGGPRGPAPRGAG